MQNKFIAITVIIIAIIFVYIMLAVTMPAGRELVSEAAADLDASANMSNFPGALGVVESSPVWIWFLPGIIGVIATVMILRSGEKRR